MLKVGRTETTLLLLIAALTGLGVVMVYSASGITALRQYGDSLFFLKRQALFAVLGCGILWLCSRFDYQRLRTVAILQLFLCILLLVLVLVPGVGHSVGGASRWLSFGGFFLQPGELAKVGLVIYLAHSLARKKDKVKSLQWGFLPYVVVLTVVLALLLAQPDFGGAVTLTAITMTMLLVAGTRWTYLLSTVLVSLPLAYQAVMLVDYRRERIMAFLNPWKDPTDGGFQIIQSWTAFGSGGLLGKGLGESHQKLFYLPEAHTDFIFSVLGEELGFVGVSVVVAMLLVLFWCGIRIALDAREPFGCYLAFGLTLLLGLQVLINMGVVLGLLPTKGLALPFISYGGTNLMVNLVTVGLLLSVARHQPERTP